MHSRICLPHCYGRRVAVASLGYNHVPIRPKRSLSHFEPLQRSTTPNGSGHMCTLGEQTADRRHLRWLSEGNLSHFPDGNARPALRRAVPRRSRMVKEKVARDPEHHPRTAEVSGFTFFGRTSKHANTVPHLSRIILRSLTGPCDRRMVFGSIYAGCESLND